MPIAVAEHILRGAITDEAEARSVIRGVAWLHLGLAFALFVFWQFLSFWVGALKDLTIDGLIYEGVFFIIILTPSIWTLAHPSRAASLGMVAAAVLTATLTGMCGLIFLSLDHGETPRDLKIWPLAFGAFALAWLGMTYLSWRALKAANLLQRLTLASVATLIAREFD